ncbi:unnamed protein product [Schistosoma margrebowiei]|uniref:Uncharacterized protein n=1 Tax=Schistosoma margrebowiei TaxID=48269 RepID=A0A183MSA7_9TREM|nr:unnamed protein product [Schistosoma margrebowiei]
MQLDDLDIADDLTHLSHKHEQMKMKTTSITEASELVGLNTHKGKSTILKYNIESTNPISLDGEVLKDVKKFTYLDSIVDDRGGSDADVNEWIGKLRTAFLRLKNIWNSRQLLINITVRIFNMNVKTLSLC